MLLAPFRTRELKEVRCANHTRAKCKPHMFQWGTSQILPEKNRAFMLNLFFRVPSNKKPASWISEKASLEYSPHVSKISTFREDYLIDSGLVRSNVQDSVHFTLAGAGISASN